MAENEANSLGDVYTLSYGLTDPTREQIHRAIMEYAHDVMDNEWPTMTTGYESPAAWRRIDELWKLVGGYEPGGSREQALQQQLLSSMNDLADARRMRLLAARDGVPGLIWAVLIGGSAVTVLFTYFFGLKNFKAQLAMTALYVASIGFVLFLVAAIDYPFSGVVSIKPEAIELVLHRIEIVEATERSGKVSLAAP